MIFQQTEHSNCTKNQSYHSWNNTGIYLRPWIPPLQQNGNISIPPEKLKTASKYKHVFSTNEWHLHTYYAISGAFMIWNYGIQSDFNHFCFLALENSCLLLSQDFWHAPSKRFGLLYTKMFLLPLVHFCNCNLSPNGQIISFIGTQAHLQTQLLRAEWYKVLKIFHCRISPTE